METEHCNRCDPSPQQADARAPTKACGRTRRGTDLRVTFLSTIAATGAEMACFADDVEGVAAPTSLPAFPSSVPTVTPNPKCGKARSTTRYPWGRTPHEVARAPTKARRRMWRGPALSFIPSGPRMNLLSPALPSPSPPPSPPPTSLPSPPPATRSPGAVLRFATAFDDSALSPARPILMEFITGSLSPDPGRAWDPPCPAAPRPT